MAGLLDFSEWPGAHDDSLRAAPPTPASSSSLALGWHWEVFISNAFLSCLAIISPCRWGFLEEVAVDPDVILTSRDGARVLQMEVAARAESEAGSPKGAFGAKRCGPLERLLGGQEHGRWTLDAGLETRVRTAEPAASAAAAPRLRLSDTQGPAAVLGRKVPRTELLSSLGRTPCWYESAQKSGGKGLGAGVGPGPLPR